MSISISMKLGYRHFRDMSIFCNVLNTVMGHNRLCNGSPAKNVRLLRLTTCCMNIHTVVDLRNPSEQNTIASLDITMHFR